MGDARTIAAHRHSARCSSADGGERVSQERTMLSPMPLERWAEHPTRSLTRRDCKARSRRKPVDPELRAQASGVGVKLSRCHGPLRSHTSSSGACILAGPRMSCGRRGAFCGPWVRTWNGRELLLQYHARGAGNCQPTTPRSRVSLAGRRALGALAELLSGGGQSRAPQAQLRPEPGGVVVQALAKSSRTTAEFWGALERGWASGAEGQAMVQVKHNFVVLGGLPIPCTLQFQTDVKLLKTKRLKFARSCKECNRPSNYATSLAVTWATTLCLQHWGAHGNMNEVCTSSIAMRIHFCLRGCPLSPCQNS